MDWQEYKEKFSAVAADEGFGAKYIGRCLRYAIRLNNNNVPIIYSLEHLASLLGFDVLYLRAIAYSQHKYYRTFTIPKKNGEDRLISEPLPNLKEIQQWVLSKILYQIEPSPFAKAFVPGRSIKENARFHRRQPMVLSLDIKDFFPSLSPLQVHAIFANLGYSKKICYYLTRFCTLDGGLPQGAPTSPTLSNIIFLPLDRQIGTLCIEKRVRYTRYADDLTFSGRFSVGEFIQFLRSALSSLDLRLNEAKTRLMRQHERQEVTGVVVNDKLQAPREMRRGLRQAIYYIKTFGLENHISKLDERRANYVSHLLGKATFVLFLNPEDQDARRAIKVLLDLRNDVPA
jgi:RNA-directed DNA polymerase